MRPEIARNTRQKTLSGETLILNVSILQQGGTLLLF
jgi:hypothetical protein